MVRTGARATRLRDSLIEVGYMPLSAKPAPPRLSRLPARASEWIAELYRDLGGTSIDPVLRPGSWDLAFDDAGCELVVELDEELHFNRYRQLTIAAPWARGLPWQEEYLRFSIEMEWGCVAAARWGKRWSSAGAVAMFGVGDPPGTFAESGAPRWKQRALYDSIKDAAAVSGLVDLVRLSIYDAVGGVTLGASLDREEAVDLDALAALVSRRRARLILRGGVPT